MGRGLIVGGLVVVVVAGLAWALMGRPGVRLGATRSAVVSISSTPEGATVRIDGAEVGKTPWFADNRWAAPLVPFELELAGFRRTRGSFPGGVEARVSLELERERERARSTGRPKVAAGLVDAGSAVEVEITEPQQRLHQRGPLRPKPAEDSEFVDSDLDDEARAGGKE